VFFDGEPPISFLQTPGAKEVGIEFQSLAKTYNDRLAHASPSATRLAGS
jgi:aspartate/methionine/tyrosine aminotransferase